MVCVHSSSLRKTDRSSGLFGMWQTMHAVALDMSAICETMVCLSARPDA